MLPCILILASEINILRNTNLIQNMKNYAALLSVSHTFVDPLGFVNSGRCRVQRKIFFFSLSFTVLQGNTCYTSVEASFTILVSIQFYLRPNILCHFPLNSVLRCDAQKGENLILYNIVLNHFYVSYLLPLKFSCRLCSKLGLVGKSCVGNYKGTIFIAFLCLNIIFCLFIDNLDIVPMFFNLHFKQFTAARIFVCFSCFFSMRKYIKFIFCVLWQVYKPLFITLLWFF